MTPQTTNSRILIRGLVTLVALGALGLALIAVTPTTVDAREPCPASPGGSCTYFSDSSYTQAVGGCLLNCSGQSGFLGPQTQWVLCQDGGLCP